MRKRLLLLSVIFSVLIVVGFKSVSASTDCDRWLQQYKEQLANAAPVKHVQHHLRHLLSHTQPRPQVIRVAAPVHHYVVKPKLSPQEMLRRFHVLCGDLPPEETAFTPAQLVAPPSSAPPVFLTGNEVPPISVIPPVAAITPVEIAAATPVTIPGLPITPFPIVPTGPGGSPVIPSKPGSPSTPGSPNTPGSPGSPSAPSYPSSPGTPGSPAIPPVPEPSSIVLVLTGICGIGWTTRRGARFAR